MDTHESKTSEEKKAHVLGQRLPEKGPHTPSHLEPEAGRSSQGLHKLIPIVMTLLAVLVALIIIKGVVSPD
ncbi:hypothetical protein [Vreelandella sp. EE22]